MALVIQMAAPTASSPEYWAQLLAESALPQSTLDSLAAEPLQATSVQSFCYGMRTREGVDDLWNYILFNVAGPQLAVTGAAAWEQGLDPAQWKFSRWAGCVHLECLVRTNIGHPFGWLKPNEQLKKWRIETERA